MMNIEDFPFAYRATAQGKVLIYWHRKQVMILKEARARAFLARIAGAHEAEQQLIMAKITGNFKHGTERRS